jgi:hypothetical protein
LDGQGFVVLLFQKGLVTIDGRGLFGCYQKLSIIRLLSHRLSLGSVLRRLLGSVFSCLPHHLGKNDRR